MSILPQMNPIAFITNFVSPFIETGIMSLEGNAERSAANLKCVQETLFLLSGLLHHQMLQQKSRVGVRGSCESCPVEILAAAESWTRQCPAWQRWGGFAFRFTPPRWLAVWGTARGEVGTGRREGRGRHLTRHYSTCKGFPVLLCQMPVSWKANNLGCKITVLGYHIRKRFPPSPSLSFVFPWGEMWRLRGKILNLGGINQHTQRDGFHSFQLCQLKEMCLGFSALCMQIHSGFLNFALIFNPPEVLYFFFAQISGCYPVRYSLYWSLPPSPAFCLRRSRTAKNKTRAGSHRQVPILLNAVRVMRRRRVPAG